MHAHHDYRHCKVGRGSSPAPPKGLSLSPASKRQPSLTPCCPHGPRVHLLLRASRPRTTLSLSRIRAPSLPRLCSTFVDGGA